MSLSEMRLQHAETLESVRAALRSPTLVGWLELSLVMQPASMNALKSAPSIVFRFGLICDPWYPFPQYPIIIATFRLGSLPAAADSSRSCSSPSPSPSSRFRFVSIFW